MRKVSPCTFCGQIGAMTKGHLVPKGIWPNGRPNSVITVPSCEPCNTGQSGDDAYFAQIIPLLVGADHPLAVAAIEGPITRSIEKPIYGKTVFEKLICDFATRPTIGFDGTVIGEGTSIAVDALVLRRTIQKIVAGLFFKATNRRLTDWHQTEVWPWAQVSDNPTAQNIVSGMGKYGDFGDDIFLARWSFENDLADKSAWLIWFYKRIGFFAVT